MLATRSVDEVLEELARHAVTVISPEAACGITLRRDRKPLTVASTDPLADQVDEVQYGEDQGPCLQTLSTGEVVSVADLTKEQRWPGYRVRALEYGVRSSLSLPLIIDGASRGAMNIYALIPEAFGFEARRRAEIFAAQASVTLTVLLRHAHQTELTDQLRDALASRSVIDQALGIVMNEQRCDADRAFDLLRTISQRRNRKLRDVATEMVAAVSGSSPKPSPFRDPD